VSFHSLRSARFIHDIFPGFAEGETGIQSPFFCCSPSTILVRGSLMKLRESSGFIQNAFLSCWIPAFAGMTAYIMNYGNINKPAKNAGKSLVIAIRLMEQLANPLSNQKTVSKWLV
jgi:hypothetical protein